uniref:Uncharacterized protein n=1 Tax=Rhizophora mucronata TaxID=61149 RepID=A0A2P2MZK8_RHIMU
MANKQQTHQCHTPQFILLKITPQFSSFTPRKNCNFLTPFKSKSVRTQAQPSLQ